MFSALPCNAVPCLTMSAVGPWFCAQMSSSSQGLGLWFRHGLLLPLPADVSRSWVNGDAGSPFEGPATYDSVSNAVSNNMSDSVDVVDVSSGWQEYMWMRLPDTHLISSLTVCITLAPITLWLGLVVWHWHNVAAAARRSSLGSDVAPAQGVAAAAAVLQGSKPLKEAGRWLQQQFSVGKRAADASCIASGICCEDVGLQQQQQQAQGSSSGSTASAEGAAAGVTGGSGSSGSSSALSPHRLARSRSGTAAALRRRESSELTAADDTGGASSGALSRQQPSVEAAAVGSNGSSAQSRSSSSCLVGSGSRDPSPAAAAAAAAADVSEDDVQLLLLSSPLAVAGAAAAGAAIAEGWLQRLVPAAASDPWQAGKQQQRRWLSPRYLVCCTLYLVVLCSQSVARAAQLLLVSMRIPLPLLLLAVPPTAFWFKVAWRLAAAYGPVALVVSPVVGWLPLLLGLALRHVRRVVAAGKGRRRD
jgi:hypothetical protein